MNDVDRPISGFHTKVWDMERHLLGSYRELIAHEIESRKLTITSLAKKTGFSRRSLKRMITGAQELRARDVIVICAAIGVDRLVATYAIEGIGGWQSYYDEVLRILLGVVRSAVLKINDGATAAIEPLTPSAQEQLAKWIADTVIENQQQIRDRRERLNDLPRL